jgi:hypothetical protein
MVAHTDNPSMWGLSQEDHEYEASLGYTCDPVSKRASKQKRKNVGIQ